MHLLFLRARGRHVFYASVLMLVVSCGLLLLENNINSGCVQNNFVGSDHRDNLPLLPKFAICFKQLPRIAVGRKPLAIDEHMVLIF